MIDVSSKFNTLRSAKAEGKIYARPETMKLVSNRRIEKGDVIEISRSAAISAAKRTSELIVFCHPLPIDWIDVAISVEEDHILVGAEVKAVWKTGVEMEALTAVTSALLNIYDMLKPQDDDLRIDEIHLVEKKGGKTDYSDSFTDPLRAGVLVVSDSTYAGTREDESGRMVKEFLYGQSIEVVTYAVLPDDKGKISSKLVELAEDEGLDLIFTTGGTGLGPRDITPEATRSVIDKEIPGIAESIRKHGRERTPYAMLSRGICGMRGKSLIINLPGSYRGARESMQSLFPGLLHAFPMLRGMDHS